MCVEHRENVVDLEELAKIDALAYAKEQYRLDEQKYREQVAKGNDDLNRLNYLQKKLNDVSLMQLIILIVAITLLIVGLIYKNSLLVAITEVVLVVSSLIIRLVVYRVREKVRIVGGVNMERQDS